MNLLEKRFDKSERKLRVKLYQWLWTYWFSKFIKPSDTVFELGCGFGELINSVKAREKWAIDVNYSKRVDKNVRYIHGDILMYNSEKGYYDVAIANNFFEHLDRNDISETIKVLYSMLKKGGKLIIMQPNYRYCALDYFAFFDHITPLDHKAMCEVLRYYGFRIGLCYSRFMPYTLKSGMPVNKLYLWIYLKFRFLWLIFGKQMFIVGVK